MTNQTNWKNYFPKGKTDIQKNAKSAKEYSYIEDANLQIRQTMEDYYFCNDGFTFENNGFFGIFDGHGGYDVAKFCKEKMPQIFKKEIQVQESIENALKISFNKLDTQLKLMGTGDVGSTACVLYILKNQNDTVAYFANIGDTRGIVFSDQVKRMTVDHKTCNIEEKKRVFNVGGQILNDRLNGVLAITRAFGDWNLKNKGLISEPSVKQVILKNGDTIIVASDGIWDVLTDQDAFNMTSKIQDSEEIAKCLVYSAIQKGSKDNISCLVIKI